MLQYVLSTTPDIGVHVLTVAVSLSGVQDSYYYSAIKYIYQFTPPLPSPGPRRREGRGGGGGINCTWTPQECNAVNQSGGSPTFSSFLYLFSAGSFKLNTGMIHSTSIAIARIVSFFPTLTKRMLVYHYIKYLAHDVIILLCASVNSEQLL